MNEIVSAQSDASVPRPSKIGRLIQALRKEGDLTQAQLGQKSGLTQQDINRIESGKTSEPRFSDVCSIADALGVSILVFRIEHESVVLDGKNIAHARAETERLERLAARVRRIEQDAAMHKVQSAETQDLLDQIENRITRIERRFTSDPISSD